MGWNTGSQIMSDIIIALQDRVTDDNMRMEIYQDLIPIFENYDCDTLDECFQYDETFEAAYKSLNLEGEGFPKPIYDSDDDYDNLNSYMNGDYDQD